MLDYILAFYILLAGLLTWFEYISFCFNDCNFIEPGDIDHIFGRVGSWIVLIILGILSPAVGIIKIVWWIYIKE